MSSFQNESSSSKVTENDIVEDRRELRLEPQVELHIIEALCSKFESVIKGYCDLSLFRYTLIFAKLSDFLNKSKAKEIT